MNPQSVRIGTRARGITVYPSLNAQGVTLWRFRSELAGRDVRRTVKQHALDQAREELATLAVGDEHFQTLTGTHKTLLCQIIDTLPTPKTLQDYLKWQRRQESAQTIPELVKNYILHKTGQKGHLTHHLRSVQIDLETLANLYPGTTLSDLTTPDLIAWHESRVGPAAWKRRNDCRGNLLALYNYAQTMGEIDTEGLTVAQRLPIAAKQHRKAIRYADRAEALFLLHHIADEYRLWLVLGLFTGMRPEEIIPEKNRQRRGLDRREIDLETQTIYISREVAGKVNKARRIPFPENLPAWLLWAGWAPHQEGPIHTKTPASARETLRLGKLLNKRNNSVDGWPKDFLRHTYASHRNAILQNLPQLAIELGNSVDITQKHYNQPLPKKHGQTYFDLNPRDLHGAEGDTIIKANFRA